MCDPLTIAGVALTAGSTVANYTANQRVQSARNDALAAERIRQNALDQEASALNAAAQDRYKDFEGQQGEKAASLADYFTSQQVAEPEAAAALPTSSSNIVTREETKQRGKARDFTDKTGIALGNLRAFGDVLGGIGRSQARDAGAIGQIGGFKSGSTNALNYELDAASQAGNGLRLLGDVLGGVGSVGLSAGLSGSNLLGGTTRTAATSASSASSGTGLRLGSLYGSG